MTTKATTLMKNAQIEKSKQTIDQLVSFYAKKEQFFKKYVPIQQTIIKKLMNAPEITMTRLKQIAQIVAEEKELQALVFEKTQKALLNEEQRFAPKTQEKPDPKDPKGTSKIKVELPSWCSNIDRILLAISRSQKQRKSKIKSIYKLLDSIQAQINKEQTKYRTQIKKQQKELQKYFDKLDQYQKQQSKIMGKIVKQGKGESIKDSSFFIGEIKKLQENINGEYDSFVQRNKNIGKIVQIIIKNQKSASKKIKDQLGAFLNYRRENLGKETKVQEEAWGFLSIAQERIEEQRLKYFNLALLKTQKIDDLKKLLDGVEFKNNWQVIVKFVEMTKVDLMKKISAHEQTERLLKNINYRVWSGVSLAQGWLIQSFTPAILYMTYDYIMIIYSKEGELLKKIHTSQSKVSRAVGQTVFLQQKIKGFFSDSIEEYKIKFEDLERLEQFLLFMENQVK